MIVALLRLFRRRPRPSRPAVVLTIVLTGALPPCPFDLYVPESVIRRAYAHRP